MKGEEEIKFREDEYGFGGDFGGVYRLFLGIATSQQLAHEIQKIKIKKNHQCHGDFS